MLKVECKFYIELSGYVGKIAGRLLAMALLVMSPGMPMQAMGAVVVDAATGEPVSGASVFDRRGVMLGVCKSDGTLPFAPMDAYPLTVRCIGFREASVASRVDSVIRMKELSRELPEVVVEAHNRVLHVLSYVREYSTLSTYTDTVTLFREKWVDYMIPDGKTGRFKGWQLPRILSAKSYYRFSDGSGTDSVSDRFNQHFSWADWIGLVDREPVPPRIASSVNVTDTVFGKVTPAEIWRKNSDDITLDVDVLADTVSRRWMPGMSLFFRNNVDFERVNIRYRFSNIMSDCILARDVSGISYSIESRGRGRSMFRFNRRDEPFFVTTYAEVYMADREYVTIKEAKRIERSSLGEIDFSSMPLPSDVPELQPDVARLVARVENIDHDSMRLMFEPDKRLVGRDLKPPTTKDRVIKRLRSLAGSLGIPLKKIRRKRE